MRDRPPQQVVGRARFLELVGMTLCGLLGLVIVAEAAGTLFFGPCQR